MGIKLMWRIKLMTVVEDGCFWMFGHFIIKVKNKCKISFQISNTIASQGSCLRFCGVSQWKPRGLKIAERFIWFVHLTSLIIYHRCSRFTPFVLQMFWMELGLKGRKKCSPALMWIRALSTSDNGVGRKCPSLTIAPQPPTTHCEPQFPHRTLILMTPTLTPL